MSEPIIAVDRVTKQVADAGGPLTILHEISFMLEARQSAAIVGASGSGKSTLLAIIAGLDTPTEGTVQLAGTDIFALDEDARAAVRAARLGFVFQSFQLLGNLTALENVMLPLELQGRRDARAQATEMLRRVGLGERLGHYPKVLSGGEQQRVALARAFVVQPAVLLADEPTGSLTILHEISFTLAAQQSAAIVGASGSGKSTLLSIIAGLDTPTTGTVRLGGTDLFQLNEDARAAERAAKLGFVFQSFQLLGNLSALENVMLPLELQGRSDARVLATEMLGRVGLSERLRHYPKVLSGGEQQRVALARAFVVKPAVLLADEPTGSLDFATGERVMELMFELNRETGTTLVLVTHDRNLAARCDRQLRIEAGRVDVAEQLG